MKIYLAAWWHTGNGPGSGATTLHQRVLTSFRYPYYLESFHYMDMGIINQAKASGGKMFVDSGAFSAFTKGAKIDIKRYARFLTVYNDLVEVASNLDAIGRGGEQATYDNQKALEEMGCKVQPVFHVRDAEQWLVKYLDEGYDYLFIGGMVPETTKWLMGWLDHAWHHYLTNPDGTAKIKVHGFGLTSLPLIYRYPWYSVDSTSWQATGSFGSIFLDFPQADGSWRDYKVDFSDRSMKRYDLNSWHYSSLSKADRHTVMTRLEQLEAERVKDLAVEERVAGLMGCKQGFYPEALAKSYGWRWYANAEYFRRAMERRIDRFVRKQDTLWD
jgi:hypothetical protein